MKSAASLVVCDEVGVVVQLRDHGLPARDVILDALKIGYAERASCTSNDPATFPGLMGWGRTLRALRESLTPSGWTRGTLDGLEVVLHPERKVAISVSLGDADTGDPDGHPQTKHPKGSAAEAAVAANQLRLPLIERTKPVSARPAARIDGFVVWYLLYAPTDEEIQCELSQPSSISNSGHFTDWRVRILPGPIAVRPKPVAPTDMTPPIDFDVPRRGKQ